MRYTVVQNATAGATAAFLFFILVFPAIPVHAASTSSLFHVNLLAPTSNPTRRQYSAIVANSWESVGIDVNLIYVPFTVLSSRLFPVACPCTPSYDNGGFDIAFIGHGGGPTYPDLRGTTEYHSEVGPPANNYPTYKNATVDAMIDAYQTDFNHTDQVRLGQQIVQAVTRDEPMAVIYYNAEVFGFSNNISPAKQQASYTSSEIADFEQWATTGGLTTANVAVTGDIGSVNYFQSASTYTQYNIWNYGDTLSPIQFLNPITLAYGNGLANKIATSADHKTYTISFKPNMWQDGVPVTSDDFLFWMMASLNAAGNSVNIGAYQSYLGLGTQFTFLNKTSRYTWNGTYYRTASSLPSSYMQNSSYTALNATAYTFTTPVASVFTNPAITSINPLPVHVLQGIPENTWDTIFGSISDNSPKTVTWDKTVFGGNGSYKYAYNDLIGNGPYIWHGYDSTSQTGTLVANPLFWNTTGLQNNGLYKIKTVHVIHIIDRSAVLAAFATGTVNAMDVNYVFTASDKQTIKANGGYATLNAGPGAGSQEMGFNMGLPIWGTGTGTPNGQKDSAHAYLYARDVRHALSDLIPRQLIISNLLQGNGVPGIAEVTNAFSFLYPAGIKGDPYDPSAATSLLAAAGYSVPSGSFVPITPPPIQPVVIGGVTITPPEFQVGQAVVFQGTFKVNSQAGAAGNGFGAILQESTDNGATWVPLSLFATNSGGGYAYTWALNQAGTLQFQVHNTGVPWTYINSNGFSDPVKLLQVIQVTSSQHQFLNTTSPGDSAVSTFKVGTLSDLVTSLSSAVTGGLTQLSTGLTASLNQLQTTLVGQINNLGTSVNSIQTTSASKADVSNLNNTVGTISSVSYAALAIAVVLGLLAIALSMRKRS